jgi:GT2 family glycosyltransferase
MCGFDDADYCVRAKQAGIDTLFVPLNIHHYWGKTRWGLPDYKKVREENAVYFEKKHGFRPDDYRVINE